MTRPGTAGIAAGFCLAAASLAAATSACTSWAAAAPSGFSPDRRAIAGGSAVGATVEAVHGTYQSRPKHRLKRLPSSPTHRTLLKADEQSSKPRQSVAPGSKRNLSAPQSTLLHIRVTILFSVHFGKADEWMHEPVRSWPSVNSLPCFC